MIFMSCQHAPSWHPEWLRLGLDASFRWHDSALAAIIDKLYIFILQYRSIIFIERDQISMNIRDLQYLVALADHCHFGKAAEACFVSQPALSMQIKKLEENLGVQLLERTNKSVLLTDTGVVIAERARQLLNQVDEIREIAKSASDPLSGEFKLGIFPTLAPYLLPHIMPALSKAFPKLFFYLVEEKTELLIEKLKQGQLHAAILALPVTENGLVSSPLFEEEFLLAVPHSHPFAKKKSIQHRDLQDKKMLLLEDGHCMREQVLSFCNQINTREAQHFRATSLETLRHMVSVGAGITLMPRLSSEGCELASFIPLATPKPSRLIGLVWRSTTSKTILLAAMQEKIKAALSGKKSVTLI
jgi:LysR family hydrogen peroxide-inducible transcriptional activator